MKKNNPKDVTNVEFGMEFGDLNSAKFYELAYSNQNKKSSKNKQKK